MELINKIKRILLVDDDTDLLEQHKMLMEMKGVEVITAETAKEGFEKFEESKPDAVIVDLIMEHNDSGFILCHKIKNTLLGKRIPVYILTSSAYETGYKFSVTTEEEREWIKSDGILYKPIVVEEVIKKLNSFYLK